MGVDLESLGSLYLAKDKVEYLFYLLTWEHVITQSKCLGKSFGASPKILLRPYSRLDSLMAYGPGGGDAGMFGVILRKG